MAQTLVSLLVHLVFSTKNRADILTPESELVGLLQRYGMEYDEQYLWR